MLSNLSGPSYEWSPAEVMAYLDRIDAAKEEALARFKETKRWRTATPLAGAASPAPEAKAETADEIDEATASDDVDEGQGVDQVHVATKPADKPALTRGILAVSRSLRSWMSAPMIARCSRKWSDCSGCSFTIRHSALARRPSIRQSTLRRRGREERVNEPNEAG